MQSSQLTPQIDVHSDLDMEKEPATVTFYSANIQSQTRLMVGEKGF